MSTLEDFVNVSITTTSQTPTRVGFGTPLVMGYHTAYTDRVRTYKKLSDLVADGITSTGVGAGIHKQVSTIFSQNPRPKEVKVGRRSNVFQQVLDLTPTTATQGDVIQFDIGFLNGTVNTITRTVPAASTINLECIAIAALINAIAEFATPAVVSPAAPNATKIVFTTETPGVLVDVANRKNLSLKDQTALPSGLTADIDLVVVDDNDWYGLLLDSNSKAEVVSVAAWAEANEKEFFYHTSDTECGTSSTTDVLSTLKTSAYFRSNGFFNSKSLVSGMSGGVVGENFPWPPGSSTYALKTIAGVPVDALSATVEGYILAKNGNSYTSVAGKSVTTKGKSAAGEYIDIAVGRDWLKARMKERIFGVLSGQRKVPYTNAGVDMVRAQVMAQLDDGIKAGYLAATPAPVVTAPRVEDVDPADRANRLLPDVTFSANLAGAIQAAEISGTLSV